MKVATSASLLWMAAAGSVQAQRVISNPNSIRSLIANADLRRLEEDDANDADDGYAAVEGSLPNYSLRLMKCEQEESLGTNDDGITQYGVAILRLCPSNTCQDGSGGGRNVAGGCSSGYADLAVPLFDFVYAYIQDQQDNMQWDGDMEVGNFAQCAEYEAENGNGASYYVGPSCTDDGNDVKMALFGDQYCRQQSDTSFAQISNGDTLPYDDGGLVSSDCLSCSEDGGLKQMCSDLYQEAPYKCEDWDINHYYYNSKTEVYRFGSDNTGCQAIAWMDKTPEPFGEWASIVALVLLVVASVSGAVGYTMWWKNQKATLERIDSDEDDAESHDYHQHEEEDTDAESSQHRGTFA